MTDKEKVLKVWPKDICESRGLGWFVVGYWHENTFLRHGEGPTDQAAWQNAAESLPAPSMQEDGEVVTLCEEHGCRDCSVCFHDEPLLPAPGNDGFQEWLMANSEGMEGEDDAESLMHVAWRAALLKAASVPPASTNSPAIPAKICAKRGIWPYPCDGEVELQKDGLMKGSFLCKEHAFQADYKSKVDKPTKERERIESAKKKVLAVHPNAVCVPAIGWEVLDCPRGFGAELIASHWKSSDDAWLRAEYKVSQPSDQPTQKEAREEEQVWRHLVKRMYDECGSTKADEFIRRVKSGEHDVPSPWNAALSHKDRP